MLLLTLALSALTTAQSSPNRLTTPYTDPATSIPFQSFSTSSGYRFGLALPPSSDSASSTSALIQLISPLSASSTGWAGISFGSRMVGPLLLVAWPSPSGAQIHARTASAYRPDACTPYTATPITIRPISAGTFINNTHLSATFLCQGCVGIPGSFDPSSSRTQEFAHAFSKGAVTNPEREDAVLSTHQGGEEGYGPFGVDVEGARVTRDEWGRFVSLAGTGPGPTPAGGSGGSGGSGSGGGSGGVNPGQGTSHAGEEYGSMSAGGIVALALVGVLYMLQGFSIF